MALRISWKEVYNSFQVDVKTLNVDLGRWVSRPQMCRVCTGP